jgi:hypothetical protein
MNDSPRSKPIAPPCTFLLLTLPVPSPLFPSTKLDRFRLEALGEVLVDPANDRLSMTGLGGRVPAGENTPTPERASDCSSCGVKKYAFGSCGKEESRFPGDCADKVPDVGGPGGRWTTARRRASWARSVEMGVEEEDGASSDVGVISAKDEPSVVGCETRIEGGCV